MHQKIADMVEKTVDLSSSLLGDEDLMKQIEIVSELKQASKLYLYNNNITDRGVMNLLINLPNLRFLDIRYNPISDHFINILQRYRWDEALRVCYFDRRTGLPSIVYLNGHDYSDNVMRLSMTGLKDLCDTLKSFTKLSLPGKLVA